VKPKPRSTVSCVKVARDAPTELLVLHPVDAAGAQHGGLPPVKEAVTTAHMAREPFDTP
jgi:hypothetical protein